MDQPDPDPLRLNLAAKRNAEAAAMVTAAGKPPRGKCWRLANREAGIRVEAVKPIRESATLAAFDDGDTQNNMVVLDKRTGLAIGMYGSPRCAFMLLKWLSPVWAEWGPLVGMDRRVDRIAGGLARLLRRSDIGEDDGEDPELPPHYELQDPPRAADGTVERPPAFGTAAKYASPLLVLSRDSENNPQIWIARVETWAGKSWYRFDPPLVRSHRGRGVVRATPYKRLRNVPR